MTSDIKTVVNITTTPEGLYEFFINSSEDQKEELMVELSKSMEDCFEVAHRGRFGFIHDQIITFTRFDIGDYFIASTEASNNYIWHVTSLSSIQDPLITVDMKKRLFEIMGRTFGRAFPIKFHIDGPNSKADILFGRECDKLMTGFGINNVD